MDEIEKYVNFDTLDVDVDEEGKVVCFADLRQKMSPVTTDKRIMKRMIKQGMGEMISNAGVVYYHYSAYVNLQEEPFDNSYLRRHRRPERLVLGKGEVLIGVELALKTMKKGEVSQFIVEPEYAFGKLGVPQECLQVKIIINNLVNQFPFCNV
ncbi:inactive peptidyl-prolyl cis-trans isomerase FKBP6-like [Nilaparvata lugens]|uniref:inactive peptidyl-prolyl cis-trans isomerase FKBP6-like n=1 Tax=Nilaparvata lugens TaxID=108931 RepID=UPI00193D14C6|nr:inactive peptidyl-prolyl cis-trans isomerase FKBP6-like [Nilaparvata lugens]